MVNKMKIAMITPWNVRCGIYTYSRDLIDALAELDNEVYVVRFPRFGMKNEAIMENLANRIPVDEIELRQKTGSLMPDNLTTAMSKQQILDLLRCLVDMGRPESMPLADINSVLHHAYAHLQGPASFPFNSRPIHPEDWPNSSHYVNRNRLYDFYTKEADYFQGVAASGKVVPALLQGFPGLDGGTLGHWGNQNETVWASDAWNDVQYHVSLCG